MCFGFEFLVYVVVRDMWGHGGQSVCLLLAAEAQWRMVWRCGDGPCVIKRFMDEY